MRKNRNNILRLSLLLAVLLASWSLAYGQRVTGSDQFNKSAGRSASRVRMESEIRARHALEIDLAVEQGRLNDALSSANEGLNALPDDGRLLALRGDIYIRLQNYPAAIRDLEPALEDQNQDSVAARLGYSYLKTGEVEKSRQLLKRSIASRQTGTAYSEYIPATRTSTELEQYWLYSIGRTTSSTPRSLPYFEAANALGIDNLLVKRELGLIYLRTERYEEADKMLTWVVENLKDETRIKTNKRLRDTARAKARAAAGNRGGQSEPENNGAFEGSPVALLGGPPW